MLKLESFFGLSEMARTAGSLGKYTRAALEKARTSGAEFTSQEFCQWLKDAGADNPNPASLNTAIKKLAADEGERPSALKPLIIVQQGKRGAGSNKTIFKYVFDGPAGAPLKVPGQEKAPEEEIPYEDEEGDASSPTVQQAPKAPVRPPWPQWMPKPERDGSWPESQMFKLDSSGFGPDHEMWAQIKAAEDDVDVHSIVKKNLPPQYQRAAITVAQDIFKNINKPWDKQSPKAQEPEEDEDTSWLDDEESEGSFSSAPEDDDESPDEPGAGADQFLKQEPEKPSAPSSGDRVAAMKQLMQKKGSPSQKPADPSAPEPAKKSMSSLWKKFGGKR